MSALPKPTVQTYAVELKDEVAAKLRGVAEQQGTSVEELIATVALEYVDARLEAYDDWSDEDVAAIERGIAQLKRGEGRPQEEVMARIKAKHGW